MLLTTQPKLKSATTGSPNPKLSYKLHPSLNCSSPMPGFHLLQLPDNLLSQIFHRLLLPPPTLTPRTLSRLHRVLPLAHTCSRLYELFRKLHTSLYLVRYHRTLEYASQHITSLTLQFIPPKNLPSLRSLSLQYLRSHSLELIQTLAKICPSLHHLSLIDIASFKRYDHAIDLCATLCGGCKTLRSLRIKHAPKIAHYLIVGIFQSANQNLCALDLENLSHFTICDETLEELAKNCPNINRLYLNTIHGVTRHGLRSLCLAFSETLGELRLGSELDRVASFGDGDVISIVRKCRFLQTIGFSRPIGEDIARISFTAIREIGFRLGGGLRRFSISGPKGFGNRQLIQLLTWCPDIREINLRHCTDIGDEGIEALAMAYREQLNCIDISRSIGVGDDGLSALGSYCSGLRSVHIEGLKRVSEKGLEALLKGVGAGLTDLNMIECTGNLDLVGRWCGWRLENVRVGPGDKWKCGWRIFNENCVNVRVDEQNWENMEIH